VKPQHFDILGTLVFAYITGFGFYLLTNDTAPEWSKELLVIIGLAGLAVDAGIVYRYFIRK